MILFPVIMITINVYISIRHDIIDLSTNGDDYEKLT
ncbi:hypothetical protein [Escherichia phage CLB_P2]|nr:hypothetical protein [Escherichia phage CLB_P2]